MENLLEIHVCLTNLIIDYPKSLTNVDILGQGNLVLVREKSGKCQGILLSIICGNPVKLKQGPDSRQVGRSDKVTVR